jgi:hypothetical protein
MKNRKEFLKKYSGMKEKSPGVRNEGQNQSKTVMES